MARRSTLTPRAWVQSVREATFGGAYLVYGPDEYIKGETVRRVLEDYIPPEQQAFGVTRLFGGQTDTGQILNSAQAVPMLGERTAAVVYDTHKLAAPHKAKLPDAIEKLAPPSLLIFVGPEEIDRRTRFYKWFTDHGRAVACEPLTLSQAETFAQRKIKEAGKQAADDAIARLLDFTGPDAGAIAREAEKLALFTGDREEITVEDVLQVAGHTAGVTIEEVVPSVLQGRRARALWLTRQLLAAGMDSGVFVGRLAHHFFDLRRAERAPEKQAWQLAKSLRLPTARAEQLMDWLRVAPGGSLALATVFIADAEALLRSGRVDGPAVTEALILALTPEVATAHGA